MAITIYSTKCYRLLLSLTMYCVLPVYTIPTTTDDEIYYNIVHLLHLQYAVHIIIAEV